MPETNQTDAAKRIAQKLEDDLTASLRKKATATSEMAAVESIDYDDPKTVIEVAKTLIITLEKFSSDKSEQGPGDTRSKEMISENLKRIARLQNHLNALEGWGQAGALFVKDKHRSELQALATDTKQLIAELKAERIQAVEQANKARKALYQDEN